MTIRDILVYHDAAARKDRPFATGDKIPGSVVQLSTDPLQTATLGSDGGLLVTAQAALPDDQVLTGDASGSVAVTLTPATVGDNTNYTIKADTKVDPAAGNAATVTSAGIYVPTVTPASWIDGVAPTIVDDGTVTTRYYGGNNIALGDPIAFEKRTGSNRVTPVYTEDSVGTTPVVIISTHTEYGDVTTTRDNLQTHPVIFSTPFNSKPFVTLQSEIVNDQIWWTAINITTTGFTISGVGFSRNEFAGLVSWKAEEK